MYICIYFTCTRHVFKPRPLLDWFQGRQLVDASQIWQLTEVSGERDGWEETVQRQNPKSGEQDTPSTPRPCSFHQFQHLEDSTDQRGCVAGEAAVVPHRVGTFSTTGRGPRDEHQNPHTASASRPVARSHAGSGWLGRVGVKHSVRGKFPCCAFQEGNVIKWFGHNRAETLRQVAVLCFVSSKRVSFVA